MLVEREARLWNPVDGIMTGVSARLLLEWAWPIGTYYVLLRKELDRDYFEG